MKNVKKLLRNSEGVYLKIAHFSIKYCVYNIKINPMMPIEPKNSNNLHYGK